MWHHHRDCVGGKLKTDGSMRRAASDPATLPLPFSMYETLGHNNHLAFLLVTIYRNLEGWGSLPLPNFILAFLV
jgi:hypothetical protein